LEDIDKTISESNEERSESTGKSSKSKSSKSVSTKKVKSTSKSSKSVSTKKVKSTSKSSKSVRTKPAVEKNTEITDQKDDVDTSGEIESKSTRPIDEVVIYDESDFELKELVSEKNEILIGPKRLTRFERARITGARALQLSLGAPALVIVSDEIRNSISIAIEELERKILPLSIRRILPNGLYQDIPIDWLIA